MRRTRPPSAALTAVVRMRLAVRFPAALCINWCPTIAVHHSSRVGFSTYAGDSADDTIFAISSGAGTSAIAVVRISGPDARLVIDRMVPRGDRRVIQRPRELTASLVVDSASQQPLDRGMAVWLPGPATVTGEDVCELHVHGGRAVQAAVCRALSALPRFRPATAGEFTRRAFAAGKLDLTAAEGLADLLRADTDAQRALALQQVGGCGMGGCPAGSIRRSESSS